MEGRFGLGSWKRDYLVQARHLVLQRHFCTLKIHRLGTSDVAVERASNETFHPP